MPMSARTNPRCTAARRNVAARETGDLVIEYFILSPVCNAHTPTATRSRFLFKSGAEKENISRCVMRGREGYGITEVGWGGERASSCHLLDGGRAFECYSYFHSTDFARQSLVRHRPCIHSRIIRGEVRTAATLSDPAPTHPSLGKSNLVNTTVDGQIPIGEGDHI